MGVESREDRLEILKAKHIENLETVRHHLEKRANVENINDLIYTLHSSGVNYFNEFERTLDEYSLPEICLSKDIINRKVEDTINIIETIIYHWNLIKKLCSMCKTDCPKPSPTAYASIQRVIKRFSPNLINDVEKQFQENGLPVYGFKSKSKHSGWKEKTKIKTQLILGLPLLIISGILIFLVPSLTGMQYLFLRLILSLGITLIGTSTIEGTMKLNWSIKQSLVINATGWIAIFILIYYFNPPLQPY
jgi:hypothetical protein